MPEKSAFYQPDLTLPDLLIRAAERPQILHIGYSDKNGNLTKQSYKDLLVRARQIAGGLFELGLHQGDKLIIATQTNQETVEMLWGSFLLGIIPTILQPPMTFSGYNPSVAKLMNVYEQLGCPYVFMSSQVKDSGDFPKEKIKHAEELNDNGEFPEPDLNPDDLAFIQFSSGSTGDPKGIMLSHSNLVVNMNAICIGLDSFSKDNIGNWMPLFHDMGLIGFHLTPIYSITSQYHIETMDFIMNPGIWLNLMSQQKIAISGCTNFGLALVLRYFTRKKPAFDWDFSAMKTLLNGAEPISISVMQDFLRILEPFGFRPDAMMPVYGMAEATLAISFTPLMKPTEISAFDADLLDRKNQVQPVDPAEPSARLLSEVGIPLSDVEVRIVDESDHPLETSAVGHIQVRGPAVTKGYYKNNVATASAFSGDWFRTGDIGFFYKDRLYISGRYKDIIFKNGRNYFANDLETMAATIAEIPYGKVCFGGITGKESGQDKVIAFVAGLPEETAGETFRSLRALLRSNLGITVDELVMIKSNEIPKTSSGKIQRYKLMQRYINHEFDYQKVTSENQDFK